MAPAEGPPAPRLVLRLVHDRPAAGPDPRGESVDVLRRGAVHAEAQALHAVAALLPVVLAEPEGDAAGHELDPLERTVLLPALSGREAQHVAVEGQALLQVADREARPGRPQPQALGLLAGLLRRCGGLAGGLRLPRDLSGGALRGFPRSLLGGLPGLLGGFPSGLLRLLPRLLVLLLP